MHAGQSLQLSDQRVALTAGDEPGGLNRIHQQLQFRELKVPAAHKPTRGASLPALNVYSESCQGAQIVINTLSLRLDAVPRQLGNQLLDRQRMFFICLLHQNPAQIQELQLLIGASGHVAASFQLSGRWAASCESRGNRFAQVQVSQIWGQ